MNPQIATVLAVLAFTIALFVFEWVRVDVVGIIMMVSLPLLGLVTPADAISGLSSNAVVSIIAVIIIGAALDKTEVMNRLARSIIRFAGKSESRIVSLIAGTVAIISSFMQNIGAAALFLPAARRIGRQLGIPVSRILMPMGFCAILGGTITLVGSSPLILLNDLLALQEQPLEPFGLFSVTPVGLALVGSGILYFILLGRFILPAAKGGEESGDERLLATYETYDRVFELSVPAGWESRGTLDEMGVRPLYLVTVVGIAGSDGRRKNFAPTRDDRLSPGDVIAVAGSLENVQRLADDLGFLLHEGLDIFGEDLSANNAGMLEGIVTPRSELANRTLRELRFRKTYEVNPLAIYRGDKIFYGGISDIRLRPGDTILLQGKWDRFHLLKGKPDLTFTSEVQGEVMRPEKAGRALFWLALSLTLILVFKVQLSIALLAGALGIIVTKVLSIDEAYQAVDWMTVFLLAGLIPLGLAFERTGAAAYIANSVMSLLGTVPPIVLLTVIGVLTSFFTLVVSNVGATVLLVPLAVNMALQGGADPRTAALVVGLAASNTFVLPTHQVNALIMRPGGYRTVDYVRAGAGMTVLFLVVMVTALYFFY
jgi:di/tricarboxylate transporter